MNNQTFLACSGQDFKRATYRADAGWTVSQLAADHPIACLAADPVAADIVYAGTRSGVLRSDDRGRSWRPAGLDGHIVKSLAVSPHDSRVIYAGTKPALMFVSRDGGQSWVELDGFRRIPNRWWWLSPAEPPDYRPYVMAIALSPTDPEVILAGVELGAVVRSRDGGQTWSRHTRGALRDCHALLFHPIDGRWLYEAGGTGGGAAFSRDGGQTFKKAGRGLIKHYGVSCAADPQRPEIWYVCVAPSPFNAHGPNPTVYLYRSGNAGAWEPIGWEAHPLKATPAALATVPGQEGHLYAGVHSGEVWHTPDFGDSWEHAIIFEGFEQADSSIVRPVCVAGAGACPPEDAGGPHAYAELLVALADSRHPNHAGFVEWAGEAFDPTAFSPADVRFDDPAERFRIAFEDDAS